MSRLLLLAYPPDMRFSSNRIVVAACLVLAAACGRSEAPNKPVPATSLAPTTTQTPPPPSVPSTVSSADPAATTTTPNPPPDLVHCKALDKRGRVALGVLREPPVELLSEGDELYLFSYHQPLARVTLSRVRRDGSPPVVVGRHTGLGEPKGFALLKDAAYFTRNKTLYRMARDTGNVDELAKSFSTAVAVHGGYVYGVRCDVKNRTNQLVRITTAGGEIEEFATYAGAKSDTRDASRSSCDNPSLKTDGEAVFVADWNGRRILRIAFNDKTVTELATNKAFPDRLEIRGDQLFFQTSLGVYRVSKSKADASRLTELGSSPFTFTAYDDKNVFIHQAEGYGEGPQWTYVVPFSSGKAQKLESYLPQDPDVRPVDVRILGIALDDECLYTARQFDSRVEVYALKRP